MVHSVSIIIPAYNAGWCLPQLVANLQECVVEGVEVIFVDDGSTDGCGEVIKGLFPEGIHLRQENRGVGAARNFGVSRAKGEFIQILDADDTIMPGKLVAQAAHLQQTGADVVYSDWRMRIIQDSEQIDEPIVIERSHDDFVEALLGGWWFPNSAALTRKSAYSLCGGCDPNLKNTCEDFHLWVQLAISGAEFVYLPGYYSNYHRYENRTSMSNANRPDFFLGEAAIIDNALTALRTKGEISNSRKAAAAKRLHAVARNVYSADHRLYLKLMRQIEELAPGFKPSGSSIYKLVWKSCGHEFAELLAGKLRR